MKILKKEIATMTIAMFLIVSIAASLMLSAPASGLRIPMGGVLEDGTVIPSYLYVVVSPNPIGVGQTATVLCFMGSNLISGEYPVDMTVEITDPSGHKTTQTVKPDQTGGGYVLYIPSTVGEYKFQGFYPGQNYSSPAFVGLIEGPSQSDVFTLTVQEEQITEKSYPTTPLPNNWWETPVSAENTNEWYKIMGPKIFRSSYNATTVANPYTESVLSGHILWTKPWGPGGVVGGEAGGSETAGMYWTARQYETQFVPIMINGKMYAQLYPETTGYNNGIACIDLKTGENLFTIDTKSSLYCAFAPQYYTPNMYGHVGPYIITTGSLPATETGGTLVYSRGTQYNFYSAETGMYIMSIVNGTGLSQLQTDENGNLIGYYTNSTVGTMSTWNPAGYQTMPPPPFGPPSQMDPTIKSTVAITPGHPVLCKFNLTQLLWSMGGMNFQWNPSQYKVVDFKTGVMWATPVPTEINGALIDPGLGISKTSGGQVFLSSYLWSFFMVQNGWYAMAAVDAEDGAVMWVKNYTYPQYEFLKPFTRFTQNPIYADGKLIFLNMN